VHQNTVRAGGRLHKRLTVQKPSTATNDDEVIHSKSHDGLTRVSAKRRTGAGRRREADDLTQSWYSMRATAGAAVARYSHRHLIRGHRAPGAASEDLDDAHG